MTRSANDRPGLLGRLPDVQALPSGFGGVWWKSACLFGACDNPEFGIRSSVEEECVSLLIKGGLRDGVDNVGLPDHSRLSRLHGPFP